MDSNMLFINKLIENALAEDIGTGDITSNSIIPMEATTTAFIYAKEAGVISGIKVAEAVFLKMSHEIRVDIKMIDGQQVRRGDVIMEISGSARMILTAERVALNLLQRLSGIATKTAKMVELLTYYNTKIVDTRKTTPGVRVLEKYAVRVGGGHNHRFGLYDGVLIKDNHIKVAGGIQKAVSMARQNAPHTIKIEVEVEDLTGVQAALDAHADIIMLDNMDIATMREAVKMVNGRALVEASGGLDENNVVEVAKVGVDLISIGALTHSVKALDLSLDVGEIKLKTLQD